MFIFLFIAVLAKNNSKEADNILLSYQYSGYAVTVINFIVAIVTYCVIFAQLWRYSKGPSNTSSLTFTQIFRNSGYYIVVLLLISYLLLMIIPTILEATCLENSDNINVETFIIFLLFLLSDTADAYIYIFKYSVVRRRIGEAQPQA